MPIGDVTSKAAGSGARYNDDKEPMHQVPVRYWAELWWTQAEARGDDHLTAVCCLANALSNWQERRILRVSQSLIDPRALRMAMQVFQYGEAKYALYNWTKGMAWSIPIACALRHMQAIVDGEETDPESGLPHLGHVYCNLIMLDWFVDHYPEGDDRPHTVPSHD